MVTGFLVFANGFNSGAIPILSGDLASNIGAAPFFGVWRFTKDACASNTSLLHTGLSATFFIS